MTVHFMCGLVVCEVTEYDVVYDSKHTLLRPGVVQYLTISSLSQLKLLVCADEKTA